MKNKVGRIWVTSRSVEKERLENLLSVIAFSMKKLSYESQKFIFLKLWLPKVKSYKDQENLFRFIDKSLLMAYELYQDRNFTGTLVFVKTIATALEMVVDRQLKSGDFNVPKELDYLNLYDKFFKGK